jgi:hypothetical protein
MIEGGGLCLELHAREDDALLLPPGARRNLVTVRNGRQSEASPGGHVSLQLRL